MIQLQHKRATQNRWLAVDPILANGEVGYETDTRRFKIGDGVTVWSSLPYQGSNVSIPGGTAGQILTKNSSTDYDVSWQDNIATSIKMQTYVKNDQGTAIYKGQAVYTSGADGTNVTVKLALANSDQTSARTLGLLVQDLANNAKGYVITDGLLSGIDTSGATNAGEIVYLSGTTPGGLIFGGTNNVNKPHAPTHMVYIGVVTKKSAGNGEILVKIQNGYELDEIHNVDNVSVALADKDVLSYESSTSLWKNKTIGSSSGIQAWDADLDAIAALTGTSGFLTKTGANTWALDTSTYLTTGTASSTYQPLDADLTAIAAISSTGWLQRTGTNTWSVGTPPDTNTTYTFGATGTTTASLNLTPSSGSTTSVTITGSGATSVSQAANAITISSTDTNTTYSFGATGTTTASLNLTPSSGSATSVTMTGSGATSVSQSANAITISSTDNNTTYTVSGGTNNGTIKVVSSNPSSTTDNIQVTGLQSAAYTLASAYLASDATSSSLTSFGANPTLVNPLLTRVDASSEGGQINFSRASDNAQYWYIDSYGSTSTPDLRVIESSVERFRFAAGGAVSMGGSLTVSGTVNSGYTLIKTDYVTTTNATYAVPSGARFMKIKGVGGGGGGGGASGGTTGTLSIGGGGGGGGYAEWYGAVTGGSTLNVTIGAGGGSATTGSTTSVQSGATVLISCLGGGGGTSSTTSGASAPGAGGTSTIGGTPISSISIPGSYGTYGNTTGVRGSGGASMLGGSVSGAGGSSSGQGGLSFGGGGSSGVNNGGTARSGGGGADGVVILEFFG